MAASNFDSLWRDVRYALRGMRRSPGFTVVALLTLALGIGANTAIFTVVEGVVLSPLPYREPDRLVIVYENIPGLKRLVSPSYPDFVDWQRYSKTLQQLAALTWRTFDLTAPGAPQHLDGQQITAGFFNHLGLKLLLGREFSAEEDRHGGAPVVLLSEHLWRTKFNASSAVLGQTVTLGGVECSLPGVAPVALQLAPRPEVYTPLGQSDGLWLDDRTIHPGTVVIGRLAPGVSLARAQQELAAIQQHIDELHPADEKGMGVSIRPLKPELVGDTGRVLILLLGAVSMVLLIACANVAGLLLARSAARSREIAVRLAIGASRARLARQLLTESILLALFGGGLGFLMAKFALGAMLRAWPGQFPRSENIAINFAVLAFTFAVSLAGGIIFGLAPALKVSNDGLHGALQQGGRGAVMGRHRAQNILVVGQVALTLVLLAGAGLLLRSLLHLSKVDPGLDPQHVITFKVDLAPSVANTPARIRTALKQLVTRIQQLPGVEAADLTALVPLSDNDNSGPYWVGARPPASMAETARALYFWTGPDYLRTMQISLLRGRYFTESDNENAEHVVVIDDVLASTNFPGQDAVGQTIHVAHWGPARVVGVVGHVMHDGLNGRSHPNQPQIYGCFYQLSDAFLPVFLPDISVAVRTRLDSSAIMPTIKTAVYGAGSDQPVYAVQSMAEIIANSLSPERMPLMLLSGFASLALALAAVGIYGLISYSVGLRRRELALRMALGAGRGEVFRMILGQSLRLAAAGILIGAAACVAFTRLLASFVQLLSGVGTADPLTFLAVAVILALVAAGACSAPARRAMNTDPATVLRCE